MNLNSHSRRFNLTRRSIAAAGFGRASVTSLVSRALIILVLTLASIHVVFAQDHWVATWTAAPQPFRPSQAAPAPGTPPAISNLKDQTVRMIVRTSLGGRRIRLKLSNLFGTGMLTLGSVHVGLRDKESSIAAGSDRAVFFNGKSTVVIPAGAVVLSDPVDVTLPAFADLAVSVYVSGESGPLTMHALALRDTYISKTGNFADGSAITEPVITRAWYWLTGVDVVASANMAAIVTFGDSITDGFGVEANHSWPSILAQRLAANSSTANWAVVNQGISGNRLLRDTIGPNALARFDRDVLSVPGVKWMTLLEGINDIRLATGPNALADDAVTADDLIAAMRQIIERAHTHGIKVIGCTLTPYEGAVFYSEAGEMIRQAANLWIRTSGAFDVVMDFDALVRDSQNPKAIRSSLSLRDQLHPNDDGNKAMADAFDLKVFAARPVGQ